MTQVLKAGTLDDEQGYELDYGLDQIIAGIKVNSTSGGGRPVNQGNLPKEKTDSTRLHGYAEVADAWYQPHQRTRHSTVLLTQCEDYSYLYSTSRGTPLPYTLNLNSTTSPSAMT